MTRLTLLLSLSLTLTLPTHAQRTAPSDDGGLRTLPSDDAEPGPRRVTQVATLLAQADFDHLDTIAARLRADKARNPGGTWRLRTFYSELNPKVSDEQVLAARRAQFEAWIQQKPQSITPRIALAEFYTEWAWVARGSKEADQVPESAWPLFQGRARKSEEVLKQAEKLDQKDPEWFSAMQVVALALDWPKPRARKLFDDAVASEPDYPTFYERYANYLLPKWDGDEHDSIDFAQQTADTLGGDRGDIVYFQIATVLIHKGNEGFRPALDWKRIQRGHAALELAFGPSRGERNHFAFIAVNFHDAEAAQKEFLAIGDKWTPSVWRTRAAFDKARTWAATKAAAESKPSQTPISRSETVGYPPSPQSHRD